MNCADQFLKLIIKNNKKFVIVSNSIKKNIDILIEFFPILSYSSKIYCSEMFKKKKPHPECYLKVVKDFPNFKMVGFEDSLTGIEALTKVKQIKPIFINTSKYYYYDHIINNYLGLINIKNFFELN
jgi:beta-phosphoglucomutase-like phosphatase (HAD superfamily)